MDEIHVAQGIGKENHQGYRQGSLCVSFVRTMSESGAKRCIPINIDVTEIHVNCGSQNVCCSIAKVEIISLAFKWLIILRSAMKMCFLLVKMRKKCTLTHLA